MNLSSRPIAPDPYALLPPVPDFTVESDDFVDGGLIPIRATGEGEGISPSLSWKNYPEKTESFLINVFDPDAPTPAGFWHWTVVQVDRAVTSLPQGAGTADSSLPEGAFHLRNDTSVHQYSGPMPPVGDRPHRYVFAVHALDVPTLDIDRQAAATEAAFLALPHTLARGTITGIYQR